MHMVSVTWIRCWPFVLSVWSLHIHLITIQPSSTWSFGFLQHPLVGRLTGYSKLLSVDGGR